MRVIAGELRGLKLKSPIGDNTRPTEDRIKENVFNVLGGSFYGEKAIDLFSGSASIGIEFLSRGADFCYFVDKNKSSIGIINDNIKKARLESKSKVFNKDALEALKLIDEKVSYIYIDPPYENKDLYLESIKSIINLGILEENGKIIIEESTDSRLDFSNLLDLIKEKKYGSVTVSFWSLK